MVKEEERAVYEEINPIKTWLVSEYGNKSGSDLVCQMGDFFKCPEEVADQPSPAEVSFWLQSPAVCEASQFPFQPAE